MPCVLSALLSNKGSFPPPALPGLLSTASPSATLPARPAPRGVPVGACPPPTGLPVLLLSPSSMRAAANTPAEPPGALVARFPVGGSLPRIVGGSASATCFSRPARRSLALRPAWSLSRPRRPFSIGVLQAMSLPPSPAPIASGWNDSWPGGICTRWEIAPFHGAPQSAQISTGVRTALNSVMRCRHRRGMAASPNRAPATDTPSHFLRSPGRIWRFQRSSPPPSSTA